MGSPTNAACAACKFQRRKCAPECPLAPWFPPDQPKRFSNVHKLFGVANVLKLFRENQDKLEDLVKSIVYEADARDRDPINGAFGVLQLLKDREDDLLGERMRLKRMYDAMLVLEEKLARQQIVYLPSNAPPQYGSGSLSEIGGAIPSSSYLGYSLHGSPYWDLQMGMSGLQSSYEKQQQPQISFDHFGSTSSLLTQDQGFYYGGGSAGMYPTPQQQQFTTPVTQQSQNVGVVAFGASQEAEDWILLADRYDWRH
ncbi:hypothetical protein R1sor_003162 [Riccia sorocarpa]|uniref:LOB domain-containing protein n=1 Tax=Riccia sorocarpa TaxID=122646 RepID=A0ABD3H0S5_9MARC